MAGQLSVYIIVPVILLLVAAGCSEREQPDTDVSDATSGKPTAALEPSSAATLEASRESLDADPCSWGEMTDPAPSEPFEDLAWKSQQVLVGTVVEEPGPAWMEPDPVHSGRPGECLQIMTDYEVEIETHYRGNEVDPLRVRVRGGELDGYKQQTDTAPELKPGNRLLMFLRDAPESEVLPDAWLAIGNRVWQISEDDQVHGDAGLDDFEVLDLAAIDERIRDVLGRQSHIRGTRNVTDDEAPIHVEHDADREPIAGTPCSVYVDFDVEPNPRVEDLAWSSARIVVGTVTNDFGPAWAEPGNLHLTSRFRNCLEIMNDYEIEVENQFHGEPAESIRIRAPGGELHGYEQLYGIAPDLSPGDRYLFFLFQAPDSEMLPDAWAFDLQRAREIQAGDVVTTGYDSSMTLDEVEQLIRETLAGEPPVEEPFGALWGSADSPTFDDR